MTLTDIKRVIEQNTYHEHAGTDREEQKGLGMIFGYRIDVDRFAKEVLSIKKPTASDVRVALMDSLIVADTRECFDARAIVNDITRLL
jgi:hypothetical protein